MLSKACKSVFVIVFLFFLVNVEVGATIGIIVDDLGMGRYAQEQVGVINVHLVEKNTNQLIVASLFDESGKVVDVVKVNNSITTRFSWKVNSGTYKIILVNIKTGEREVHYSIL